MTITDTPTATPATTRPCPDCAAPVGAMHEDGCDIARCLWTGRQRLQCSGAIAADCCRALRSSGHTDLAAELGAYLDLDDPDHDCGREAWTGEWSGVTDARRLGFWCYWGPDYGETGWVECAPDHPGAQEDLNRLRAPYARWDRTTHQWEAIPPLPQPAEPTVNLLNTERLS